MNQKNIQRLPLLIFGVLGYLFLPNFLFLGTGEARASECSTLLHLINSSKEQNFLKSPQKLTVIRAFIKGRGNISILGPSKTNIQIKSKLDYMRAVEDDFLTIDRAKDPIAARTSHLIADIKRTFGDEVTEAQRRSLYEMIEEVEKKPGTRFELTPQQLNEKVAVVMLEKFKGLPEKWKHLCFASGKCGASPSKIVTREHLEPFYRVFMKDGFYSEHDLEIALGSGLGFTDRKGTHHYYVKSSSTDWDGMVSFEFMKQPDVRQQAAEGFASLNEHILALEREMIREQRSQKSKVMLNPQRELVDFFDRYVRERRKITRKGITERDANNRVVAEMDANGEMKWFREHAPKNSPEYRRTQRMMEVVDDRRSAPALTPQDFENWKKMAVANVQKRRAENMQEILAQTLELFPGQVFLTKDDGLSNYHNVDKAATRQLAKADLAEPGSKLVYVTREEGNQVFKVDRGRRDTGFNFRLFYNEFETNWYLKKADGTLWAVSSDLMATKLREHSSIHLPSIKSRGLNIFPRKELHKPAFLYQSAKEAETISLALEEMIASLQYSPNMNRLKEEIHAIQKYAPPGVRIPRHDDPNPTFPILSKIFSEEENSMRGLFWKKFSLQEDYWIKRDALAKTMGRNGFEYGNEDTVLGAIKESIEGVKNSLFDASLSSQPNLNTLHFDSSRAIPTNSANIQDTPYDGVLFQSNRSRFFGGNIFYEAIDQSREHHFRKVEIDSPSIGRKKVDLEIKTPANSLYVADNGLITIPSPLGHQLGAIEVRNLENKVLLPGIDYQVFSEGGRGAYLIKISDPGKEVQFSLKAGFTKVAKANGTPPVDLKNLNREILLLIATHLDEAGLKDTLGKTLREMIQGRKKITIEDLTGLIRNETRYTYIPEQDLNHIIENAAGPFSFFAKFIDPESGRLCFQCDGANQMLSVLLDKYFTSAGIGNVEVRNIAGFHTSAQQLKQSDLHALTLLTGKDWEIVLDATPMKMDPRKGSVVSNANDADSPTVAQILKNMGDPTKVSRYLDRLEQLIPESVQAILEEEKLKDPSRHTPWDIAWTMGRVTKRLLNDEIDAEKAVEELRHLVELGPAGSIHTSESVIHAIGEKAEKMQMNFGKFKNLEFNARDPLTNSSVLSAIEPLLSHLQGAKNSFSQKDLVSYLRPLQEERLIERRRFLTGVEQKFGEIYRKKIRLFEVDGKPNKLAESIETNPQLLNRLIFLPPVLTHGENVPVVILHRAENEMTVQWNNLKGKLVNEALLIREVNSTSVEIRIGEQAKVILKQEWEKILDSGEALLHDLFSQRNLDTGSKEMPGNFPKAKLGTAEGRFETENALHSLLEVVVDRGAPYPMERLDQVATKILSKAREMGFDSKLDRIRLIPGEGISYRQLMDEARMRFMAYESVRRSSNMPSRNLAHAKASISRAFDDSGVNPRAKELILHVMDNHLIEENIYGKYNVDQAKVAYAAIWAGAEKFDVTPEDYFELWKSFWVTTTMFRGESETQTLGLKAAGTVVFSETRKLPLVRAENFRALEGLVAQGRILPRPIAGMEFSAAIRNAGFSELTTQNILSNSHRYRMNERTIEWIKRSLNPHVGSEEEAVTHWIKMIDSQLASTPGRSRSTGLRGGSIWECLVK